MTSTYRAFVAEGKGQPKPWDQLKNQVFLGTESFVADLQAKIQTDKDLSEVPQSQRRAKPRSLEEYDKRYEDRNAAIVAAYASGGYRMKTLGDYFGLHYSRISRIISQKAKDET